MCLVLSICILWAGHAEAAQAKGSITITMKDADSGAQVPGGALRYYRVASIFVSDDRSSWRYTTAFSGCGIPPEEITTAQAAETMADYAKKQSIQGVKAEVDKNARVQITNLNPGVYLMVQDTPAEGYSPVAPFLVTVPTSVDGEYIYDVDATPKLTLKKTDVPPNQPPRTPRLPKTGQLWWPVPLLAAAGIVLLLAGLARLKRVPRR